MVAGLQRPLCSRYAVYLTASRWAAPRRSEGLSPGIGLPSTDPFSSRKSALMKSKLYLSIHGANIRLELLAALP
jgi:hypothetical protein